MRSAPPLRGITKSTGGWNARQPSPMRVPLPAARAPLEDAQQVLTGGRVVHELDDRVHGLSRVRLAVQAHEYKGEHPVVADVVRVQLDRLPGRGGRRRVFPEHEA